MFLPCNHIPPLLLIQNSKRTILINVADSACGAQTEKLSLQILILSIEPTHFVEQTATQY